MPLNPDLVNLNVALVLVGCWWFRLQTIRMGQEHLGLGRRRWPPGYRSVRCRIEKERDRVQTVSVFSFSLWVGLGLLRLSWSMRTLRNSED